METITEIPTRELLAYYMLILEKVSFSQELFSRQCDKATRDLAPHHIKILYEWVRDNYPEMKNCICCNR